MPLQFSALDERSARLNNPANVVALSEEFARSKYSGIA
jgi:hypothetical protein